MVFYALTTFLAAFLLFQIQPMIAKMILPWFGGCCAVWSAYMLFFQGALLLGYLHAHGLHEGLPAGSGFGTWTDDFSSMHGILK